MEFKFKELDLVRVVRLGRVGKDAAPSDDLTWVVGREAIFDSYFVEDGVAMVWLDSPDDGWEMFIFEEDDLEATGRSAPRLPDDHD